MKPAKNSNNQGSKTKDLNENSTPKIQSYFKSTPKLFVIEDKSMKNCSTSKDFYVEGLKRKLQSKNPSVFKTISHLICYLRTMT